MRKKDWNEAYLVKIVSIDDKVRFLRLDGLDRTSPYAESLEQFRSRFEFAQ